MKHGSLCTGIGVFDLAFELAGFELAWQVEIEPFCNAILESHWPNVRRYKDVREVGKHNLEPVDILTAGFPCQDLSVAGKRAGLTGERSGLFFDIARVIGEIKPRWFVLENVPGLLSSEAGRDFGIVLGTLADLGYGVGYRILDSEFFGVAQRRRRVFIVGYLGSICPVEVLFESPSSAGYSAQGGEARQEIANSLTEGTGRVGSRGCDDGANIIEQNTQYSTPRLPSLRSQRTPNFAVSPPLRSGEGAKEHPGDPSRDEKRAAIVAIRISNYGGNWNNPIVEKPQIGGCSYAITQPNLDAAGTLIVSPPLRSGEGAKGHPGDPSRDEKRAAIVAVAFNVIGGAHSSPRHVYETEQTGAIQSRGNPASGNEAGTIICAPANSNGVRSAPGTPEGLDNSREMEESLLPAGLDSARYRVLGNAVTLPVAHWIAQGIAEFEEFELVARNWRKFNPVSELVQ